jgi:hypothetical protein
MSPEEIHALWDERLNAEIEDQVVEEHNFEFDYVRNKPELKPIKTRTVNKS